MEADWNFNNNVEALINQLDTGLKYTTFIRYPVTNPETVDIAMRIVLKTGLFREAYSTWHAKSLVERAYYNCSQIVRD